MNNHKKYWLTVIGINEDGISGLSQDARSHIENAELVIGGARHLELAKDLITGKSEIWQSPIERTIEQIMRPTACHRPLTTVLASGDPFCYGIGATLNRFIPIDEMLVIPAPSCFSLAAARLGWALQDTVTIGLNGRALEKIIPHLQPNAKIMALSTDETTPHLLMELLKKRGFDEIKFLVLEHLGGEKERIVEFKEEDNYARLNMIALEIMENSAGNIIPISSGIDDSFFEHDGQLTKREIRAITLSSLAPKRGQLLWDIGLGAGSIAIEWMLHNSSNRAIGFEKIPERAERAKRNAINLGVPDLRIIEGSVPDSLREIEAPDAIFIGGGAGNPKVIETAWSALKKGGRMVINSVTVETEATILAAYKKYGGDIIRIGIERSEAVGTMTGLRPAMSVLQWSVVKY
ncbi:MAG: precorrin-6y C5,15-methyltransferase (decarboxylating) subunit CbiE [Rickettsiales bacterium]